MFTGIIEEVGRIGAVKKGKASAVLSVEASVVTDGLKIGDSVAVNGVCLTVTSCDGKCFFADVMHETLNRSTLSNVGAPVNLERAMPANGRFGGHIVSGHIDGVGTVSDIKRDDTAVLVTVRAPQNVMRYVVEKGSIAVDGISLTVAAVTGNGFTVSVIPHTFAQTVLKYKSVGSPVNLESDVIGKYVEKLCGKGGGITREFLTEHGYN